MTDKTDNMNNRPVLVTTTHRGVFAGTLIAERSDGVVELEEARMAVSWDAGTRGVLGLASHGPGPGCRITRAVLRARLAHVAAIIDMTSEAWVAWQAEPWG